MHFLTMTSDDFWDVDSFGDKTCDVGNLPSHQVATPALILSYARFLEDQGLHW